ncbi:alpha 1,2-mannosyltransferase 2.4.1 [Apophysomyces sp. BC1034]|nr:alpha 1,2-mannosyltransferase 2.4.1 [Apophysomyces sp. BC1034]
MDLIQPFYKENNDTGSSGGSSLAASLPYSALPEHRHTKHLGPDFIPDRDIPLDVWSNLHTRGAFYMLVRNEDLQQARSVMRSIEDRFNHKFHYPWILLNNQYFTADFRRYVSKITQSPIYYGKVDMDAWSYPSWIDVPLVEIKMLEMELDDVYKGGSMSYHHMLRYQAGLFYWHPLFKNVDYVWRVESGASYSCDMEFDPFRYMKENNKTLGFTLTMREASNAIPTLWSTTREFMDKQPEFVLPPNKTIMPWIADIDDQYNMCHIWNNFELVDMSFLKSSSYNSYFEYLDRSGGFFYERWGDAPIRTMAAAMFLQRNQIHFFNRIGYSHSVASHCPFNAEYLQKCSCTLEDSYDFHHDSCTISLLRYIDEGAVSQMTTFAKSKLSKGALGSLRL